jgi:hypothetical protein
MRILTKYILGIFMLTGLAVNAQVKYSNEFLDLGVGARALGMGNVYVANTNDVTAGYWNPAGLLNLENNLEVGLMHSEYFAGIASYEYGGVAFKIDDKSAAGVTLLRFGIDDIPDTRQLVDANGNFDYNKIETFSSTDNAMLLSYARQIGPEALKVGGNVKIVYRSVGDFANAIGFGIDLSAQYHKEKLKLGVMLRDITGTWNAWRFNNEELEEVFIATGNEVPTNSLEITVPRTILAAGYKYKINEKFGIYPEVNLAMTFDGKRNVLIGTSFMSIDPRIGFEANYRKMIFLRGGLGGFQQETEIGGEQKWSMQPNMGVGVKLKKVALDYALTNIGDDASLYSNVFSLRIGINKRQ